MRKTLPSDGRKPEEILAELKSFGLEDPDYRHSRAWSLVYYLDPAHGGFPRRRLSDLFLRQRP